MPSRNAWSAVRARTGKPAAVSKASFAGSAAADEAGTMNCLSPRPLVPKWGPGKTPHHYYSRMVDHPYLGGQRVVYGGTRNRVDQRDRG